MLETGINIIEWPSLQYCTISAFGGDALRRKAMSHKSIFIIIENINLKKTTTQNDLTFNRIQNNHHADSTTTTTTTTTKTPTDRNEQFQYYMKFTVEQLF